MCNLVDFERMLGGLDQLAGWFKISLSSSAVEVLGDNPHCLKLSSC